MKIIITMLFLAIPWFCWLVMLYLIDEEMEYQEKMDIERKEE